MFKFIFTIYVPQGLGCMSFPSATFNRNAALSWQARKVSNRVWCGAGFKIALEPLKLQKEGENPEKGHFIFCGKVELWYAPNPGSNDLSCLFSNSASVAITAAG